MSRITNEFTLYWWDRDGEQHRELVMVSVERALRRAESLANGPASKMGIVKRIMITDGGDCCAFEWTHKDGVVFPKGQKEGRYGTDTVH